MTHNLVCPRCLGGIPNDKQPGQFPGALSRQDNKTEICSACGVAEAMHALLGATETKADWPIKTA